MPTNPEVGAVLPTTQIDTRIVMGMPVTITIIDPDATTDDLNDLYAFFADVEGQFSTYRADSELSRLNDGRLSWGDASASMRAMRDRADETKRQTAGHFDAWRNGRCDLAGVVKGWAIATAAQRLRDRGRHNFCVNAGGDIQTAGYGPTGNAWRIGIRNPAVPTEIVQVVALSGQGIATSGTYERGAHIYHPVTPDVDDDRLVSVSVIGANVYDADRFATGAFAMGRHGIGFIQSLDGFEGYAIYASGRAQGTGGFRAWVVGPPE